MPCVASNAVHAQSCPNNGGRYLDTISEVTSAALPGSADVDVNGGIRCGKDMIKASRLGARAVMMGRAARWEISPCEGQMVKHVRNELVRHATHRHRNSHCVLGCFDWTCPDDFPSRPRLEHGWLFSEGVNACPLLGRRLFDDNKFCKARNKEGAILLQFFITNSRKRLHDAFNVALFQLRMLGNLVDELRLRHGLRHICSS